MKSALLLLFLTVFVVAISAMPAEEETDQPQFPWYTDYSYQYMMCRLKCRQSCLEKGYWKGVCKQGACYCYGPAGAFSRASGFSMPMY